MASWWWFRSSNNNKSRTKLSPRQPSSSSRPHPHHHRSNGGTCGGCRRTTWINILCVVVMATHLTILRHCNNDTNDNLSSFCLQSSATQLEMMQNFTAAAVQQALQAAKAQQQALLLSSAMKNNENNQSLPFFSFNDNHTFPPTVAPTFPLPTFAPTPTPAPTRPIQKYKVTRQSSSSQFQKQQQQYGNGTTTTTSSNSTLPHWNNRYEVVHVITSQFQQRQPELFHLGRARLDLLQQFAMRSLQHQSHHEFLWIIWTDPKLHSNLWRALLDKVASSQLQVLILTSRNDPPPTNVLQSEWLKDNIPLFKLRQQQQQQQLVDDDESLTKTTFAAAQSSSSAPQQQQPNRVLWWWTSNVDMLDRYRVAAHEHVLVETRLDIDDALHRDFVQTVQRRAQLQLQHVHENADTTPASFLILCAQTAQTKAQKNAPKHHPNILEWTFVPPWMTTTTATTTTNSQQPQLTAGGAIVPSREEPKSRPPVVDKNNNTTPVVVVVDKNNTTNSTTTTTTTTTKTTPPATTPPTILNGASCPTHGLTWISIHPNARRHRHQRRPNAQQQNQQKLQFHTYFDKAHWIPYHIPACYTTRNAFVHHDCWTPLVIVSNNNNSNNNNNKKKNSKTTTTTDHELLLQRLRNTTTTITTKMDAENEEETEEDNNNNDDIDDEEVADWEEPDAFAVQPGTEEYAVLRARGPTSHSLQGILPQDWSNNNANANASIAVALEWRDRQVDVWKYVATSFGIRQTDIVPLWRRLAHNVSLILQDAAQGVCQQVGIVHCTDQEWNQRAATLQQLVATMTTTNTGNTSTNRTTTTTTTTTVAGLWKNKYGVVHVVTSRFQQRQPDLLALGRARLDLLRNFALPSLRGQTTREFLWIIFTDPKLRPELLQALMAMVGRIPNAVVLANPDTPRSLRSEWFHNLPETAVLAGSWELVRDYHHASADHPLVETRLDVDDAIHRNLVQSIQRQTQKAFLNSGGASEPSYLVLCVREHLLWKYFNPWDPTVDEGGLHDRVEPHDFCITPGFTLAYSDALRFGQKDLPTAKHDLVHEDIVLCAHDGETNCRRFVTVNETNPSEFAVVRSRTPASNDLVGVIPDKQLLESPWKSRQQEGWKLLGDLFRVNRSNVVQARRRFAANFSNIVDDAETGMCQVGFSACTEAKKVRMKIMRDMVTNNATYPDMEVLEQAMVDHWNNEHGVVHVVTSQYQQKQPDLLHLGRARLDLFQTFALPSMKAQTTQEYLWIIFTDPDIRRVLKRDLLDLVSDISNVIVIADTSSPRTFQSDWYTQLKPGNILSGRLDLLKSYYAAAKTHPLLETRVDVDDAIHRNLLDSVQREAKKTFYGASRKSSYLVLCIREHLEWKYFNPWNNASDQGGIVEKVEPNGYCISTGLTFAYSDSKIGPQDLPAVTQQKIHKEIPACKVARGQNCRRDIVVSKDKDYGAVRARTPTSNSLHGIFAEERILSSKWKNKQHEGWRLLEKFFGMDQNEVIEARARFAEQFADIIDDSTTAACQEGFSGCSTGKEETMAAIREHVPTNILMGAPDSPVEAAEDESINREWSNENGVVHILTSRFQQGQPDLQYLGRARLDLFQHFALPSVKAQTNQEFLWVIFTDRDIHADLKEHLLKLLVDVPNVVVIASEDPPESFRSDWYKKLTPDDVFFGSLILIENYYKAAKKHPLLETQLDVDDAIHKNLLSSVQKYAKRTFQSKKKSSYLVFCVREHLEWKYFNPWDKGSNEGAIVGNAAQDGFCITPGLTVAFSDKKLWLDEDLPSFEQNLIHKHIPECTKEGHSNCRKDISVGNETSYAAVRACTPTSHRLPTVSGTNSTKWKKKQQEGWSILETQFGMEHDGVVGVRSRFVKRFSLIVEDAGKSVCPPGAPNCKEKKERMEALRTMAATNGAVVIETSGQTTGAQWTNKKGVVHVVTSRFQQRQPDLIHLGKARLALLENFALPSIKVQTTKEFLWLIFTDRALRQELKDELLNLVKDLPNVVVVAYDDLPKAFHSDWYATLKEEDVFFGSRQLVKSYHDAAQTHPLLETRLDVDDGIHNDLLLSAQIKVKKSFLTELKQPSYLVMCVRQHLEWKYFNPWQNSSNEGAIINHVAPDGFCISAGLTFAYSDPGIGPSNLPTSERSKLHTAIPTCQKARDQNCRRDFIVGKKKAYAAVVARTPYSNNLLGVLPDSDTLASNWKDKQTHGWKKLEEICGIDKVKLIQARSLLNSNFANIMQDATNGMCQKGFSPCTDGKKERLAKIREIGLRKFGGGKSGKPSNVTMSDVPATEKESNVSNENKADVSADKKKGDESKEKKKDASAVEKQSDLSGDKKTEKKSDVSKDNKKSGDKKSDASTEDKKSAAVSDDEESEMPVDEEKSS